MNHFLKWIAGGIVAGLLFGVLDASIIVFKASDMFFTQQEMLRTAFWTLAAVAGAGTIAGLLFGMIAEPLVWLFASSRFPTRRYLPEAITGAIIALPLSWLFWTLTSGPQASQIPGRSLVVLIAALVSGLFIGWGLHRLVRFSRKWILLIVGLLLGTLLYLADLMIMVRLYPAGHIALALAAVFSVTGSVRLLMGRRITWIPAILLFFVAAGLVVATGHSLKKIRSTQNPGFVISQKTAMADKTVRLARMVMPSAREQRLVTPPVSEPETVVGNYTPLSLPGASVFLITVDAMRFDRLKPGAPDPVAPNLDRFAQQAVFFERAYTPLPHTSYALSSMLTGKYTGPLFDVPGAPKMHETWPRILQRFEYATGAFFTKAVFFIDRPKFEPYLQSGYGFHTVNMDYEPTAEDRVRQTIDFIALEKLEGRSVFAWTHFFEPHEPYEKSCTRFGTDEAQRYDCEIHSTDKAIGTLLDYIHQSFPGSIVIVTADHGEEFEDHGGRYHGTTLFDEQIRVPLIMEVPGIAPRVVDTPVSLVDLMGTVLAILDIPVPARVRSNTLEPLLQGVVDPGRTAFSQVHGLRMAVRGQFKLIWDRDADIAALYDLKSDPAETRSITDKEPALVASLKNSIEEWDRSHALVELRPITTESGDGSWPVPIQQALGNDPSSVPGLIEVLGAKSSEIVRRKAAELLFVMSPKRKDVPLPSFESERDPVVRGWLLAIPHSVPRDVAAREFAALAPNLTPFEEPWMHGMIIRLEEADDSAAADLGDAIGNTTVPIEQRKRAVILLGEHRIRSARKALLAQIDNFPLALDVTRALSRIGDASVVPFLIKRLKRERAVDRRLEVARDLSVFKDARARTAIATELTRPEPLLDVIPVLDQMGASGKTPTIFTDRENKQKVALWRDQSRITLGATKATSIILSGTEGRYRVSCNGSAPQSVAVISNTTPTQVRLENCIAPIGGPKKIELNIAGESVDTIPPELLFAALFE